MSSSDDEVLPVDIFKEPDDYYPQKPSAHYVEHPLLSGQLLCLRLVGSNPLWGHRLWNGAKVLSNYLETHIPELILNKAVLELGAGAGLPSLVAAIHGASQVVVTDYPDPDLVENLQQNADSCQSLLGKGHTGSIAVEGYLWGSDVQPLLNHLPSSDSGFDTLILADILFNHHCHEGLASTVFHTLARKEGARALVFFTPYRPWVFDKDLAFFDLCRDKGMVVEKVLEEVMEFLMFEDDRGDELLRRTVFGYEVTWPRHLWEQN